MDESIADLSSASDPVDDLHAAVNAPVLTPGSSESGQPAAVEVKDGPVGVDIGTSRLVKYTKDGASFNKEARLNAFFSVPYTVLTKNILTGNSLFHKQLGKKIFVMAEGAESFANIANGEVRRPMAKGVVNPNEKESLMVMEELIKSLVPKPKMLGERLCYSVPAAPRGLASGTTVFHDTLLKSIFTSMGYMTKGVNEGYLIVLSELEKEQFTGIGISCGAGLCNVCLSYLSVPILQFSVDKGGDYIDMASGLVIGEHINRVRVIKEESLNLIASPKNRVERALHIYYEEMIIHLIQNLKDALEESDNLPKISQALPIVLSGGTAKPNGFRDKFDNMLRDSDFPVPISEVRLAEEPLYASARGAYLAACLDSVEE